MPAWIYRWIHNKTLRLWLPPFAGFLCYGTWALFVNYVHGWESAIIAGLTQGSYSFVITLVLALVIEYVFVVLVTVPWRNLWVFLAGAILLVFTSVGINLLTGTPEILWTVLPGLTVSLVYTVIYILALNKVER